MWTVHRRKFLGLSVGGFVATAGCLADGINSKNSSQITTTSTPDITETETPTPEPASVEDIFMAGLQSARIELTTPDSIGIVGQGAGKSLFVSVETGQENPPDRSEFQFKLNETVTDPMEKTRDLWRRSEPEFGNEYTPAEGGWLAFDLPEIAGDTESARLHWPGGSWQLPTEYHDRFGSPIPTFDLVVDAPDTVPVGSSPAVRATFENTGSEWGTFLLTVNRFGPWTASTPEMAVRRPLEPGERDSVMITPSFSSHAEIEIGDTTELNFEWLGGETARTIEFVEQE